jgi:hypothetical protein
VLGKVVRPWQDTATILGQFGATPGRARRAYHAFVAAGMQQGRRADLQGGGLVRSHGGWRAVAALRRGREGYLGDERILGRSAFVDAVRQRLQAAESAPRHRLPVAALVAAVCAATGCHPTALQEGSRRSPAARAREGVAYLALEVYGYPAPAVADSLGVHPSVVYRAAQRGGVTCGQWDRLLTPGGTIGHIQKKRPR